MKTKTEIQYFYDEITGKMNRKAITETVERAPCVECENGELLTGEVEVIDGPYKAMAIITLALTAIGAAVTIGNIFRRK
ncbi:MAG: hypothetical protein K2P22_00900 [Lachnospiraceae bacterium]|nr:hypothetical protein [Lachnospiraceae bacterium]